jgi:hypothetical protein
MVDDPLGLTIENCTRRVDVDHLGVNQSPVPFLWILLGSITKEPRTNRLLNFRSRFPTRNYVQLMPVIRSKQTYIVVGTGTQWVTALPAMLLLATKRHIAIQ